jgi:hypothetical protein
MSKALIGFILAVALTSAFVLFVGDRERGSVDVIQSGPISRGVDAEEARAEVRPLSDITGTEGDAEESPDPDAITDRSDQAEELAYEEPPLYPITLPSEFTSWLLEEPRTAHEYVQRDAFDPDWAPAAESEIYRFISEQPEITATHGSPIINCRTASCEIAFVAYGIDNSVRASSPDASTTADGYTSMDFARAMSGFWERDGVAELFGSPAPFARAFVKTEDGVTTILWYPVRGVFD